MKLVRSRHGPLLRHLNDILVFKPHRNVTSNWFPDGIFLPGYTPMNKATPMFHYMTPHLLAPSLLLFISLVAPYYFVPLSLNFLSTHVFVFRWLLITSDSVVPPRLSLVEIPHG